MGRQNGTSTKTRIKTFSFREYPSITSSHVRMVLPQKQGLRPGLFFVFNSSITVRMVLPQKQGLRLLSVPVSTELTLLSEWYFHKNKD